MMNSDTPSRFMDVTIGLWPRLPVLSGYSTKMEYKKKYIQNNI